MVEERLVIEVTLDGRQVVRATSQVDRSIQRFGRNATRSFGRVERSARSLSRVITRTLRPSFARVAGIIAGGFGAATVARNAGNLERSIAEIGTITGRTADQLSGLRQGLLDVAVAFDLNELDATAAAYQAISAGAADVGSAVQFVGDAARLGVAGLSTTREAADLLILSLNAYGREASEAADASDTLFRTVQLGRTTIPELSSSISTVLPLASSLGVSLEEVGASLATLTSTGAAGSTAEAATQLRGIFAGLLRSTEDIDRVFQRVGRRFDENTLRTEGLASVLRTLQVATEGSSTEILSLLGRVEGATAAIALGGEQFNVFAQALEEFGFRAGVVDDALSRITQTTQFTVSQAFNAARIQFLELGDAINDSLADAIESFGGLPGLARRLQPLIDVLAALADVLIDSLAGALRTVSDVVEEIGTDNVVNVVVGSLRTVQGLVLGIARTIRDAVAAILDALRSLSEIELFGLGSPFAGLQVPDLGNIAQDSNFAEFFQGLAQIQEGLSGTAGGDGAQAVEVRTLNFVTLVEEAAIGATNAVQDLTAAIGEYGATVQRESEFVRGFNQAVEEFEEVSTAANAGAAVATTAIEGFAVGFGNLVTGIASGTQSAGQAFANFFRNLALQILNTIAQLAALEIATRFLAGLGFGTGAGGGAAADAGGAAQGGTFSGLSGGAPLAPSPGSPPPPIIGLQAGGTIVSARRPRIFPGGIAVGEGDADELVAPLSRGRSLRVDLSAAARGRLNRAASRGSGGMLEATVNLVVNALDPRSAAQVILEPSTRRQLENAVAESILTGQNQALRRAATARG